MTIKPDRTQMGHGRFTQLVYMCFVDLDPRGTCGRCCRRTGEGYFQSESCVRVLGSKLDSFLVAVGPVQGCTVSPIVFLIIVDRVFRHSAFPALRAGNESLSQVKDSREVCGGLVFD